jgi:hypothetical protein
MLRARIGLRHWLTVWLGAAAACGGDFRSCPAVAVARQHALPAKLSETGLYAAVASDTIADGVEPYQPQFALWSDAADKRRFIGLPAGVPIDTRDPDDWRFPEGTKLWKEFTRAGVRVETRLLQKVGPADADWVAVAYVWNDAGDDADAAWSGQPNARGTSHDVPAADQCQGCHAGRKSRVLGFSAVQLARVTSDGTLDLAQLTAEGRISQPLPELPRVPGDETDRAALGYLHANCSHCHNQARPDAEGPRCYDPQNGIDFRLLTGELDSVAQTAAVRSTVRHADRRRQMLKRMATRERDEQMPPLATEQVDTQALSLLRAWLARF